MYKRSLICAALALGAGCRYAPAFADDTTDSHLGAGVHDVTDPELATMRGRYVAGDNTVVWFGVEMISTLQTSNGQLVQSTLSLGMNFSRNPNSPQVTFVPTVTITTPDAPIPTGSTVQPSVNRSVQSGGLANVGGLVQSVQVAGDNNATANVTSLNIQSGNSAPSASTAGSNSATAATSGSTNTPSTLSSPSTASVTTSGPVVNTNSSTTNVASNSVTSNSNTTNNNTASTGVVTASTVNTGVPTATGRTATVGNASASSTYANNSAEVTTSVMGEGSTSQWIHAGSLGQTIALTTDNAVVTNQMIVNLVTQQLSSTSQLAHTLAQSISLSHLNGH